VYFPTSAFSASLRFNRLSPGCILPNSPFGIRFLASAKAAEN
jgi:hypothetical protein